MSDKYMILNSMNKISVIVLTRNRAKALKNISLRSLARQTYRNFEVIVWDASDDDSSQRVVMGFKGKNQSIDIKYFKAPRKGIASQRNDAVKTALGGIVFFIDNDSEVSPEGLDSVLKEFDDLQVFGVGLSLKSMGVNNDSEKYSLFRKIYCNVFKHSKISILNFTWSLIGEIIYQFSMSLCSKNTERIKGIKMGLKAILNSPNNKV